MKGFLKGKKFSVETRKKMSESSIGKPGTNNGRKFSAESSEKKSKSRKEANARILGGLMIPWDTIEPYTPKLFSPTPWNKGRKFSDEEKDQLGYFNRKKEKLNVTK